MYVRRVVPAGRLQVWVLFRRKRCGIMGGDQICVPKIRSAQAVKDSEIQNSPRTGVVPSVLDGDDCGFLGRIE